MNKGKLVFDYESSEREKIKIKHSLIMNKILIEKKRNYILTFPTYK